MRDSLNEKARRAAVIVAAGKGLRAEADIPKQYIKIHGKPMFFHSVDAFIKAGADEVVIVVPKGDEAYVRGEIFSHGDFTSSLCRIIIVPGGDKRHDSVYEGLKACRDAEYVWIHDAARPFVTQDIIKEAMAAAEKYGAAVPVVAVRDTIYVRAEDGKFKSAPNRDTLRAAQTPQTFRTELILKAHEWYKSLSEAETKNFKVTDDAMLVYEATGISASLTRGSPENIKVTTPEDIDLYIRSEREAAK